MVVDGGWWGWCHIRGLSCMEVRGGRRTSFWSRGRCLYMSKVGFVMHKKREKRGRVFTMVLEGGDAVCHSTTEAFLKKPHDLRGKIYPIYHPPPALIFLLRSNARTFLCVSVIHVVILFLPPLYTHKNKAGGGGWPFH